MRQSQHKETNTQLQPNSQTIHLGQLRHAKQAAITTSFFIQQTTILYAEIPVAVVESEIRVVDFLQVAPLHVVKRLTDVFGIKGR